MPIPPRRLATGLLGASFAGVAPAVTLVAFAVLPLTAAQFGVLPVLVAVPAALLELVMVVLLSRVVAAGLAATMSSRRGQELGGLLMAVVIALASGGWSLATVIGQQLAAGTSPALGTALRVLPSGWGAVAVAAADRSDWPVVLAALTGLAVLSVLLLGAWARLLPVTMRRSGGRAPRAARSATAAGQPAAWERLLPASPTGAVVAKELRAWRRDPGRSLLLLLALLISGLNLAVPALAFHVPAGLPWVGLAAALIVAMGAANLYGDDGTALWLTRMVPGVERADVRGRQVAWLLVVAPVMVALTVSLTAFSGQGWAWPWVLATLAAVLGAAAGLGVLLSVTRPVRQKDPNRRTGPFDTGDDPNAAGALLGQQYLLLVLVALAAVPAATLVLLGGLRGQPQLDAAGVVVGVATGGLLFWWGGRVAARRLADRGAELMDLVHLGPTGPDPPRPDQAGARGGGRAAALEVRRPEHPVDGRDRVDRPPGPGPDRLQPVRRRPAGQGLVRRPLPPPGPADPGRGRLHRRGPARHLVGRGHRTPPPDQGGHTIMSSRTGRLARHAAVRRTWSSGCHPGRGTQRRLDRPRAGPRIACQAASSNTAPRIEPMMPLGRSASPSPLSRLMSRPPTNDPARPTTRSSAQLMGWSRARSRCAIQPANMPHTRMNSRITGAPFPSRSDGRWPSDAGDPASAAGPPHLHGMRGSP